MPGSKADAGRNDAPDLGALRGELLKACLDLVRLDLVARTWGNLSVRTGRGSFLITPSGIPYEDLEADDMVEVSLVDLSWTGAAKPSSEKELHALVYRLRPAAGAIVHTHQFWASAVAAARVSIPASVFPSSVPCAPYALPTTRPLAKAAAQTLEANPSADSVLLANHGAVCLGTALDEAIAEASSLESRARAFVLGRFAAAAGAKPGTADSGGAEKGSENGHIGTASDEAVTKLLEAFVAKRGRVTA